MELVLKQNVFESNFPELLNSRKRRHSDSAFSDDDVPSRKSPSPAVDDDRRAHHNELERRRRDHIKDHFMALKEVIPNLDGEKSSRAIILKRATDYIRTIQSKYAETHQDLAKLQRRNEQLEARLKEHSASNSPPSLSPLSKAGTPSSGSCVPMPVPKMVLPSMPSFSLPNMPTPAQIPTSTSMPSLDTLRMNGLLPPSQDNLLALSQMLLNQTRFAPKPVSLPQILPDLHSLLLSTLRNKDQFATSVKF